MKRKTLVFVFIAVLSVFAFIWAKWRSLEGDQHVTYTPSNQKCFAAGVDSPYKYCVHIPADGKVNGDIAYLLHGRGLDENIWNDDTFYTAMIQQYWFEHLITPPTVVTVSFGKFWLLAPKGKAARSGLLEVFTKEVIPEVEQKIGKPVKRIIFGESMGGLNSLIIGMKTGNLFKKVAALCPAVYLASPFSAFTTLEAFIKRTGADPKTIFGVIKLSKDYFADETEWNQASPPQLLEKMDKVNAPHFYLSCGLYDKYGNFEGNQYLADYARKKNIAMDWHPLYGGHCAIDIPSLSEFLANKN